MRLLVATPHYPPESGGPGTYAKILADNFPALGVTVEIVRFAEVRPYPKILRPILYLRLILRKARNADVILALDPVSTGVPSAIAAMLLKRPLVAKIVGDRAWERAHQLYGVTASPEDFVKMTRVPLPVALYRKAQQWVAGRAKRIIVPGNGLKRIVSAWGVPEDKIEVVYNSVEPGRAGTLPNPGRAAEGFTIVTVARLIRLKHIDAIIAAVEQVPGANLIVVGDGPERAVLESLAGNNPAIQFTGALPNEEALAIIASADALVLNSSWETFSHVLIEALMQGVPIIATRTGGNPEILAEDSGILIPVGDTVALAREIQRLKDDPELRERLRHAAQARAETFSIATMLKRTMAVLTSAQPHG